jgi:putative transposase
MEQGLLVYRRNLPHWRLDDSVYFTTWGIHPAQADFTAAERSQIAAAIKHFEIVRYRLFAYVVMNDHCHALLKPLPDFRLQSIVQSWKSFTTRQFHSQGTRTGQVYQREYFDRIVRNEDEFWENANCILNNPFTRWPELTEYAWTEWFAWD